MSYLKFWLLIYIQFTFPYSSHVTDVLVDIAAIFDGSLDPYVLCKSAKLLLLWSKKIRNDQELLKSDPTSCPQNQKGNN